MSGTRTKVLWIGDPQSHVCESLDAAGFIVQQLQKPPNFDCDDDVPLALIVDVETAAPTVLHHCKTVLPAATDRGVALLIAASANGACYASFRTQMSKHEGFYTEVQRHPGAVTARIATLQTPRLIPAANLQIDGALVNEAYQGLLRRAFGDYQQLVLEPIEEGTTGSSWIVNGVPHNPLPGEPVPFFAKVAPRALVERERENYLQYVNQFLPSTLCPRLEASRCAIGYKEGILVISFVEDTTSLLSAFEAGLAAEVVMALFDRSLRAWQEAAQKRSGAFVALLDHQWLRQSELLKQRADQIGLERNLSELLSAFTGACDSHFGQIHGDLHHRNVRVCGRNAIVLDFEKSMSGPTIVDRTLLEVSLAFEAIARQHEKVDAVLRELYSPSAVLNPPTRPAPGVMRRFIVNICQMRRASHWYCKNPEEYAWGVSAALLRYARLPTLGSIKQPELRELDSSRRCLSLELADQLITELQS